MKKINTNIKLGFFLVVLSVIIYIFQLIKFHSPRDTAFYFLQDMAFLPLQIAIATVALGKALNAREKRERLNKTNMAISAFFSEAGTEMITTFIKFGTVSRDLQSNLDVTAKWTKSDFEKAVKQINHYDIAIDCQGLNLQILKTKLLEKRDFLLRMLENPNLLEHDTFTDMLWATFHLTDELMARENVVDLPAADISHLTLDTKRAFRALLIQWVYHMQHLQAAYPYLFSLETRRNPFNNSPSVIIKQ